MDVHPKSTVRTPEAVPDEFEAARSARLTHGTSVLNTSNEGAHQ
jgi:hypothetical protein